MRVDFNKISSHKIEIKIFLEDRLIIRQIIELDPEFFDEESAEAYARMLAQALQAFAMPAQFLKKLFGDNPEESDEDDPGLG